jgi:hypothetical protein
MVEIIDIERISKWMRKREDLVSKANKLKLAIKADEEGFKHKYDTDKCRAKLYQITGEIFLLERIIKRAEQYNEAGQIINKNIELLEERYEN